jgi:uncharacterized membrane protein SpoIIM required for sporulation
MLQGQRCQYEYSLSAGDAMKGFGKGDDSAISRHESKKSPIAISVPVSLQGFLCNNAVMMILAFIAAMLLGGFPPELGLSNGVIAMLSLMVMMSLSLTALKLKGLKVRNHSKAIRNAFLLSRS